jgi:lambda family phage portal protein
MKKVILLDEYGNPITKTSNRVLASGYSYAGASLTKPVFKGWNWTGGSPDDDIVANLPIVRQRSRQLTMDSSVIAGMYDTFTTYTVGTGLIPEPTPDADFLEMDPDDVKKFKKNVKPYWKSFAESTGCDVRHQNNFYELTQLICRSADESGDCFVTMPRFERRNFPFALKIQVTEADCISDPDAVEVMEHERQGNDVYGGVELSPWGNVVGYWFYTGHPLSKRRPYTYRYNDVNYPRWLFIPAYGAETGLPNVLHIMKSLRPGQRRGLPIVAGVIELALILDRYMKAEAIAAQIQAMFTLVVTSENPDAAAGEMEELEGDEGQRLTDGDESLIALGPGVVQYARPGEKVEPVNPSRPTTSFAPFMQSALQMMGASTLPMELLLQKFDQSFSAIKGAVSMASTKFKIKREGLVNDFCQQIYAMFMDEAVMRGWIYAPGYFEDPIKRLAYQQCKWSGIGMPQVDLKDAVAAARDMIALGISTGGEQTSELTGGDYIENLSVRAREIQAAIKAGLSQNAARGELSSTAIRKEEDSSPNGNGEGKQNG